LASSPIPTAPAFRLKSIMSWSGLLTGGLRSSMVLITLKMVLFTPMPRANVNTATAVKPGFFASMRTP
jgi:hypothetical protein